jgi:hypothetical protein
VLVVVTLLMLSVAVGLIYVAAPANDWYLPGQTVTLRTAVENHVNGHLVVVGVADDGGTASIAVNTLRNDTIVAPGDTVGLGWGQRLRVISIDGPARNPDGADAVGGVGAVVVRITLG